MAAKKKRGQPTKLTDALQISYLAALQRCFFVETAAAMVGVTRQVVNLWLRDGKKAKSGIYFDFFSAVQKTLANKEADIVDIISASANEEWQAAAWLLERRFPERWSSVTRELAAAKRELEALKRERDKSGSGSSSSDKKD